MKIRTKITLWISGTALLSTMAFSAVVFRELVEQPFLLIDREIQYMTEALVREMTAAGDIASRLSAMPYNPDAYWIMVKDDSGKVLYKSGLTRYTDLARPGDDPHYLIEKKIPRTRVWLGQDDEDDVMFRVLVIRSQIRGAPAVIRIAKPIEWLEEDLIRLAVNTGISLLVFVLLVSWISYVLAGRILRPVQAIIRKSGKIGDTSLDQRIPLPESRDELYALSVSLNRMFDRLENSFDQQKEFIRNASHELKSPVTLLMLAQEDMLMNEDLPASSAQSMTRQLQTTRRMSQLIKNLLDLSRMQQQERLTPEKTDLAALMAKVLDDYDDVLAERQIAVTNEIRFPLEVMGDKETLFRLFVNLIDNAIRYNLSAEGRIHTSSSQNDGTVCIRISNTGEPIPDQDLPRLFEQFHRVEKSRSQSLGGSGLGLAIAKKIVTLHQGRISVANTEEGMITVTLCLPAR